MSVEDKIRTAVDPALQKLASDLPDQFLAGVKDIIDDAKSDKIKELLAKAADYHYQALTADDKDLARQYASAAESALRRVKTLALAEQVVASQELAALLQSAAEAAFGIFKDTAAALLSAAISGAVQGIAGGEGGGLGESLGDFLG